MALEVQTKYGENKIQQFADDIGVEYGSLKRYKSVARAFEKGRRLPNLSFGVAMAFAAQEDRHELVAEKSWTVREARALVASRAEPDTPQRQHSPAAARSARRYAQ